MRSIYGILKKVVAFLSAILIMSSVILIYLIACFAIILITMLSLCIVLVLKVCAYIYDKLEKILGGKNEKTC